MAEGPKRPLRAGRLPFHSSCACDDARQYLGSDEEIQGHRRNAGCMILRSRYSPPITISRTWRSRTSRSIAAWRRLRASRASTSILRVRASVTRSWWSRATCFRAASSSPRIPTPTCTALWVHWHARGAHGCGRDLGDGRVLVADSADDSSCTERQAPARGYRQGRDHHPVRPL